MVDATNYKLTSITDKTDKTEESIINLYVNKWFEFDSEKSSTRQIRRIIDSKYKNADLNESCLNNVSI